MHLTLLWANCEHQVHLPNDGPLSSTWDYDADLPSNSWIDLVLSVFQCSGQAICQAEQPEHDFLGLLTG
jgi:hypothetical protein